MKRVLVIVVAYNGMHYLERCLSSVTAAPGTNKADSALGVDVFVVDNDSTDGSADFVQAHFPQVKLVRSAENLGFTGGNNLGFRYALEKGYDFVYLLNQDAWLEEGALETLVAASLAHPEYAVLSPLQMTDGYKTFDAQFAKLYPVPAEGTDPQTASASLRPLPTRNASDDAAVGPSLLHGRGWPWVWKSAPSAGEPVTVKRIMAAHWMVPVKALQAIGPFSELFPYYGQDDDWCHRAKYHGYKIGVVPQARAVHDRASRQESLERIIDRNYRVGSLVRLCDINRPLWERFLYVCVFTLVKAVRYRSFLPFKHFRSLCAQLPAVRSHRQRCRR